MVDLSGIDAVHHERIRILAERMEAHGTDRKQPVRSTFVLLGDRWTTLILLVLHDETWRYGELRRMLGRLGSEDHVAQRVLTRKLRGLERDGFVLREASADIPPRVNYSLTPLGLALHERVWRLIEWVTENEPVIEQARARFDMMEQDA